MPALLKRAGELGLLMIDIPEQHGGLGARQDDARCWSSERGAQCASFSVSWGAHTGIGTLPIVYFGTDDAEGALPAEARDRRVARGLRAHRAAARAATRSAPRPRRSLRADGKTTASTAPSSSSPTPASPTSSWSSPRSTARSSPPSSSSARTPGVSTGPEEHKIGIRGSSTCQLDPRGRARCPPTNVLGEIGKGHKIAFNILNIGRFKLGARRGRRRAQGVPRRSRSTTRASGSSSASRSRASA